MTRKVAIVKNKNSRNKKKQLQFCSPKKHNYQIRHSACYAAFTYMHAICGSRRRAKFTNSLHATLESECSG